MISTYTPLQICVHLFDFQRCLTHACGGFLLLAPYGAQTLSLLIRLRRTTAPAVCDTYWLPTGCMQLFPTHHTKVLCIEDNREMRTDIFLLEQANFHIIIPPSHQD